MPLTGSILRRISLSLLVFAALASFSAAAHALEKQPFETYHARRVALAQKLQGGAAIFFAAEQPLVDFMPYRQDEDFYYLTGWNEPGAALLIFAESSAATPARKYREILFLPTRNLRMEKYTGEKLDAANPHAEHIVGVDEVLPMADLAAELNKAIAADRRLTRQLFTEPDTAAAKALVTWVFSTLGSDTVPPPAMSARSPPSSASSKTPANLPCSKKPATPQSPPSSP